MLRGFVRVKGHACATLGLGKIIEVSGRTATVSWFDSPLTESRVEQIETRHLVPTVLGRHTRVYWLDYSADTWRVGRILDADDLRAEVRFADGHDRVLSVSELEVRWDRAIEDPVPFLAGQINESPQFAEGRTRFARSLITQRGGCSGMSALISSIIDLEQHQYEVVKRVLQDPVERYLLADEVGLGKTIEAGILIRQYALDSPQDHRILVIVPPPLVVQWRRELRQRFLLEDLLDDSLHVLAMNAGARRLLEALRGAGMVVIDEAHHLNRVPELYADLREAIIAVPRLLLLSATPVLHNERGFLEMLHLLDPHVFRLEAEAEFRQRIEHRQALAETVAGLVPENLLQIEDFIDDLIKRFPDDALLVEHAESLRDIVSEFPEESDPIFLERLTRLRAHLTETYRLDRRILRNRRRDLPFLTPHRGGVDRIGYSSSDMARIIQAVEAWRSAAAEAVYSEETGEYAQSLATWFRALLESALTDPNQVTILARERLEQLVDGPTSLRWEQELLAEIEAAGGRCADDERLNALRTVVANELQGDAKIVVFCSQPSVADTISEALQCLLSVSVGRHAPHDDPEDDYTVQPWERFLSDPAHRVLVCDAEAEEGLNLQGGAKVIIHFDLPLAPNRIEQRLGRADRYGKGEAVRSFALCCSNNPYACRWFTYLDQGLRVFDRSVAALQYLIDDEMQALTLVLLLEGVDALSALTERASGDHGSAERELRRIDDQDALDALTLPDEESQFDALTDIDGDWCEISESVQQWMFDILRLESETSPTPRSTPFGSGVFRFVFLFHDRGHSTLIPLERVRSEFLEFLEPGTRGGRSWTLKTGWYSCRRGTAIGSTAPPEGIRLVRWGEAFVDRIQRITDLDERGRVVAVWRQHPGYGLRSDIPADLFLRFDFVVETDISVALSVGEKSTDPTLQAAFERRGDMALAPFYRTIWLDEELSVVGNPDLLELLEAPYQKTPGDAAHRDWNLNSQRWPWVNGLGLPVINAWRQWIPEARKAAERSLRDETGLEQRCQEAIAHAREVDEGRFAQLRTRIRYAEPITAEETRAVLAAEEQISEALYAAIRKPRITLSTVAAVFVSPHALSRLVAEHG